MPIPLRVPYCVDPENMTIPQLEQALRDRDLDTDGDRRVLVARLLAAMVLPQPPNPLDMDDRQPEKWMLIANQAFDAAVRLEADPSARIAAMSDVNEVLESAQVSRQDCMHLATGTVSLQQFGEIRGYTELHGVITRLATALMIQPWVESELVKSVASTLPNAEKVMARSRTIFNMITGYHGISE